MMASRPFAENPIRFTMNLPLDIDLDNVEWFALESGAEQARNNVAVPSSAYHHGLPTNRQNRLESKQAADDADA